MNFEAFYKMSYGLYLISSKSGDQLTGYIANTAFQVTANPPQIAISCHKENYSANIIEKSKCFALSVLEKETDSDLIGTFGYSSDGEKAKFEKVDYTIGKTGAPVISTNALATFECELVDKFDIGSHYLFIGKVVEANLLDEDNDPLTYDYYRNVKKAFSPKHSPTYIDKSKIEKEVKKEENDIGGTFICPICAYVYDPAEGDPDQEVKPGTSFADVPEDWICPICAAAKSVFVSEN